MKKLSMAYALTGLLAFAPVAFAHGPEEGYPMGPWGMGWGHGTGWWIFPLIMMAIMVIFFLFFVFSWRRGGRAPWCGFGEHGGAETPLDILKKRYARGEIGKKEFEEMKKDL